MWFDALNLHSELYEVLVLGEWQGWVRKSFVIRKYFTRSLTLHLWNTRSVVLFFKPCWVCSAVNLIFALPSPSILTMFIGLQKFWEQHPFVIHWDFILRKLLPIIPRVLRLSLSVFSVHMLSSSENFGTPPRYAGFLRSLFPVGNICNLICL